MDELQLQDQLVAAVKDIGYGFKLNNKYLAGIPDLFLSVKGVGHAFIETKILERKSDIVLISPIQSVVIKRLQTAGAAAGIMAVRRLSRAGDYDVWVSYDASQERALRLGMSYIKFEKRYGEAWPIVKIIDALNPATT